MNTADTQSSLRAAIRARRFVFAGLALVLLLVTLGPFRPNVTVSEPVRQTHDFIAGLDSSDVVFVSFDFEASSYPEMKPLATAVLRHLGQRGVQIVGLSLFPEGAGLGAGALHTLAEEFQLEYGADYLFLGMKPQPQAAILGLGQSVRQTFPDDYYGSPLDSFPILAGVDNFDSVTAVVTIADGSYPAHWVAYGKVRYGVSIYAAVAASMMTTFDPFYYSSHDIAGLIGGLRGAAEYEALLNYRGMGSRSIPALAGAHIYLALVIITGNVLGWRQRRRRGA